MGSIHFYILINDLIERILWHLLYCLQIVKELRRNDIKTELYPDVVKLKKQMSYANAKGIPYVIMAGEEEINNNQVTIKNMVDGQQYKVNAVDVSEWILNNKN